MATIDGTPGDDGLIGTPGDDTINGYEGNDVERGRAGNDTLNGDDGHDYLVGGDGSDTLNGGTGDDYLRGGEGDDVIDGGAGLDRAAFTVAVNDSTIGETGVQTGVTVDLNIQGVAQDTGHGMDTLIGIESVSGTTYDDTLIGDNGDNWIWGEGGNDNLQGGGGNDLIETDAGNSVMDGGSGVDTAGFRGSDTFASGVAVSLEFQGSAQTVTPGSSITLSNFENLTGTIHDDSLTGDSGDNVLAGDQGNDILAGGAGNDRLYGDGQIAADTHGTGYSGPITTVTDVSAADASLSPGNDFLVGGLGDDYIDGGGGIDTASYATASGSVFVNLTSGTSSGADGKDMLVNIENVDGSAYNDTLFGSNGNNVIDGADGSDTILGRGGNDQILGGDGDDLLRGEDGNDSVYGGDGNDYVGGGAGNDLLDGGSGWNRASFSVGATSGVTVDLNVSGPQDTGQGIDTLINIQHVTGTNFSDTLIGNAGDNWLWGGYDVDTGEGGNDTISGGGGNDLVEVGRGNHVLSGGTGVDTLSFQADAAGVTSGISFSLALQGSAQATGWGNVNATQFENVSGSSLNDSITGNGSSNILLGDRGNDTLSGGDGNDTLYGDGQILINGPLSSAITLFGDVGRDLGLADGNDTLVGGKGDDFLYGGRGNDVLTGSQGNDTFVIEGLSGQDVITDFNHSDKVLFDASSGVTSYSQLVFTQFGNDTVVTWGTSDSLHIVGLKPRQLSASDFQFGASSAAAGATSFAVEDHSANALHDVSHDYMF
jgi:Ca2+-binding RTX toxin-like protein